MFQNAFKNLDRKKWFDRMQPQTLAIGTWLLYIDGVFATLRYLDRQGLEGLVRSTSLGKLLAFVACASYIVGGFLMANGKKFGWYVSLGAAFSPFILRAFVKLQWSELPIAYSWVIKGQSLVNFSFEAALCALLLHEMTRTHVNRWLR
jgi:hypothetical protein